jgi:hypothetical protein
MAWNHCENLQPQFAAGAYKSAARGKHSANKYDSLARNRPMVVIFFNIFRYRRDEMSVTDNVIMLN